MVKIYQPKTNRQSWSKEAMIAVIEEVKGGASAQQKNMNFQRLHCDAALRNILRRICQLVPEDLDAHLQMSKWKI
ncbi:unnamed protein product [Acanthoscelides obtectus]|uniref:Uncharacterized protein n=1 Tax=Acanthoscelides obtectus TaxID=200917 RepID=A0A9P0KX85_ACAOB|nr:unnamed protein product [Acanthoscelides obtectus]CAK1634382.1 hypothetical protein AOBTE_LOCUS8739 [Acanthoscelides obtectus]